MIEQFEIGDVVQMKSGGPKMTVTSFDPSSKWGYPNGATRCKWFTNKNSIKEGFFLPNTLKLVEKSPQESQKLRVA
jgi:uncharacterized protein YodC (DUF2158 family)